MTGAIANRLSSTSRFRHSEVRAFVPDIESVFITGGQHCNLMPNLTGSKEEFDRISNSTLESVRPLSPAILINTINAPADYQPFAVVLVEKLSAPGEGAKGFLNAAGCHAEPLAELADDGEHRGQ